MLKTTGTYELVSEADQRHIVEVILTYGAEATPHFSTDAYFWIRSAAVASVALIVHDNLAQTGYVDRPQQEQAYRFALEVFEMRSTLLRDYLQTM